MAELASWVNDEREKGHLHPLLIIAIFVVVFLENHPFQDGNGRLSRVLTTLLTAALQQLHEGSIAPYRLHRSEYIAWQHGQDQF